MKKKIIKISLIAIAIVAVFGIIWGANKQISSPKWSLQTPNWRDTINVRILNGIQGQPMTVAREGMHKVLGTISTIERKDAVDSEKCRAAKHDVVMSFAPIFIDYANNYFDHTGWGGNNSAISNGIHEIESLGTPLPENVTNEFAKFNGILVKYNNAISILNEAKSCHSIGNVSTIVHKAKTLLQDPYIQKSNQSSNLQTNRITEVAREAVFNYVYSKAYNYYMGHRVSRTDEVGNIKYTLTRNESNALLQILEEYPTQYRSSVQTSKIDGLKYELSD